MPSTRESVELPTNGVFESNSCTANDGVIYTDGDVLVGEDKYTFSRGNGMEPSMEVTDLHGCETNSLNFPINANATAGSDITLPPAECINIIGSFVCGCGDPGFTTDINVKTECLAVDDCLSVPCGPSAYCKDLDNIAADGSVIGYANLENTSECECNADWEPTHCADGDSGDNMACTAEILAEGCKNVDECDVGMNAGLSIAQICTNVLTGENQFGAFVCVDNDGSFTCTCQNGYKIQGSVAEGNFACFGFL